MWQISGNGLEAPSYLYGTMHVSQKVAFHLSDSFYVALHDADMVALESDPSKWIAEQTEDNPLMSLMMMGMGLAGYGNSQFYDKAFALEGRSNNDILRFIQQDQSAANNLLYRFADQSGNTEEHTYLDLFIFQTGVKWGKEIFALENNDTTYSLLIRGVLPDKDDPPMDMYGSQSRITQSDLEDAYRRGDIVALDSLNQKATPSEKFHNYFIEKRNIIMANRMDSLMKAGRKLFTGVGAGHLAGDLGMIQLLREKGYSLRPVQRKITGKSKKAFSKAQDQTHPIVFEQQWVDDSLFSVSLPDKLYPQLNMGGGSFAFLRTSTPDRTYLCPDMVNGSSYGVVRFNHFSDFEGSSQANMFKRVDSLLYEGIPGEILSRNSIETDGVQGFEITNRTRRGDFQRFRIYVTPIEVIIFKMGGKEDYVDGKEAETFFSSIKFHNAASSKMQQYVSPTKELAIQLPASVTTQTSQAPSQKELVVQAYDYENEKHFVVMKSSLIDYSYIEDDTFELLYIAEKFIENFDYEMTSKGFSNVNGYPAADVSAKHEDHGYLHVRTVIRNTHYYLICEHSKDANRTDAVFNSLEMKAYQAIPDDEYLSYADSVMRFDAQIVEYPAIKPLIDIVTWDYFKINEFYGAIGPYAGSKELQFSNRSTGETLNVSYQEYSRFKESEHIDSFWSTTLRYFSYTDYNTRTYYTKKWEDNGTYRAIMVLEDSGSVRQMQTHFYLRDNYLHTVTMPTDSVGGISPWQQKFLDTFTPMAPEEEGISMFADKTTMWLDEISNPDTAISNKAWDERYQVTFEEEHYDRFLATLSIVDTMEDASNRKGTMYYRFSDFTSKKALAEIEKRYDLAGDTASYQLALLYSLQFHQTKPSTELFIKLLLDEVPLADNSYEIDELFYSWGDSAALTKMLFPEILDLLEYPEYEEAIYNMVSGMAADGDLSKSDYGSEYQKLLRKAKVEVKRQMTAETSTDDDNDYGAYYGQVDEVPYSYYEFVAGGQQTAGNALRMLKMLLPFKANADVKELYTSMLSSNSKAVLTDMCLLMHEHGISYPDTMWTYLASDKSFAPYLRIQMRYDSLLNLFPKDLYSVDTFAKYMMYPQIDEMEDSVVFVGQVEADYDGDDVNIYYWKRETGKRKKWVLDYIIFEKEGDQAMVDRFTAQPIKDDETAEEKIEKVIRDFRILSRPRAQTYGGSLAGLGLEDMY